ncbi:unnamed protein product [Tilletia laevis]|uniref:FHA domain-containing protein n=3 Tax=Tilletia TaxID=13289 RepID=A0A8X7MJL1_9BASI|nr:hypothetical protein CF336_g9209 [Tilletia laevis]KAE8238296.1 hypothetical protein A4X06_0g8890 [Tilletia controversa]CAD6901641.1 unnamed protein product [Tilletia laevis]
MIFFCHLHLIPLARAAEGPTSSWPAAEQGHFDIGPSTSCNDPFLSTFTSSHPRITFSDGIFTLLDSGKVSTIRINGRALPLQTEQALLQNDIIEFARDSKSEFNPNMSCRVDLITSTSANLQLPGPYTFTSSKRGPTYAREQDTWRSIDDMARHHGFSSFKSAPRIAAFTFSSCTVTTRRLFPLFRDDPVPSTSGPTLASSVTFRYGDFVDAFNASTPNVEDSPSSESSEHLQTHRSLDDIAVTGTSESPGDRTTCSPAPSDALPITITGKRRASDHRAADSETEEVNSEESPITYEGTNDRISGCFDSIRQAGSTSTATSVLTSVSATDTLTSTRRPTQAAKPGSFPGTTDSVNRSLLTSAPGVSRLPVSPSSLSTWVGSAVTAMSSISSADKWISRRLACFRRHRPSAGQVRVAGLCCFSTGTDCSTPGASQYAGDDALPFQYPVSIHALRLQSKFSSFNAQTDHGYQAERHVSSRTTRTCCFAVLAILFNSISSASPSSVL